jgi:acetyl-CoA decarbonylase/synthase complex subunit gamma
MDYAISPGLYACGRPNSLSPVFATANFKLTFDILRKALHGISAWILALDTKGVNVWCAAGKGTFGTKELIERIKSTRLKSISKTGEIILPQLGAPGIAAHVVQKSTSLRILYGPAEARHIPKYLARNRQCTREMRRVQFPILSRLEISLYEFASALKWILLTSLTALILASFRGNSFSIAAGWDRTVSFHAMLLTSLFTGTFLFAALLPWLPGRAFTLKGFSLSLIPSVLILFVFIGSSQNIPGIIAAVATLQAITLSLALAFTGASTFTSLSGVKRETGFSLPFIASLFILGAFFWPMAFIRTGRFL